MINKPAVTERLAIFESVAAGFLRAQASRGETSDCAVYLDGADTVNGASYPRRAVVLAVEELKQRIEAPLPLVSEASSVTEFLKLSPAPELKLYPDVATAILRIDAALRLARRQRPIRGAIPCLPA
jgi:hypothetical protein